MLALQASAGPLQIRSDSEYVVEGIKHIVEHGHLRAARCNADLWRAVAADLAARPPGSVSIRWVKGHAKQIDIERGRTTTEDKWGNDAADKLATSGASLHAAPLELVQAARNNREQAEAIHNLYLKLMELRELREAAMHLLPSDESDSEDGPLFLSQQTQNGPQVDPG